MLAIFVIYFYVIQVPHREDLLSTESSKKLLVYYLADINEEKMSLFLFLNDFLSWIV
jgi:hypothetical protein